VRVFLLAALLALPAAGDGVYAYRLRGEVRLLLLWLGKDDVGGGRITVARSAPSSNQWHERIEVLFGSDPDKIPKGINRWGYGREEGQWVDGPGGQGPRLAATEFQGIMRHSPEASFDEALAATRDAKAAGQFLYDTTVSRVLPGEASSEFRVLSEKEDFDYRSPQRLLSRFQEHLAGSAPLRRRQLVNAPPVYGAPYGFLTGVSELIRQALGTALRPSLNFVYNASLYKLEILSVRPVEASRLRPQWKAGGVREVSGIRFRCFNTVKRTRTDFELWVPRTGELKGIPVRILLQPRWWLRLQMDLDPAGSSQTGGGRRYTGNLLAARR
jgi:hypothetical protein